MTHLACHQPPSVRALIDQIVADAAKDPEFSPFDVDSARALFSAHNLGWGFYLVHGATVSQRVAALRLAGLEVAA